MPIKERVALGILVGLAMYLAMVGSYRAGEEKVKREDKSGITIDYLQSATGRFKNLYYSVKEDAEKWHDSTVALNKINLKILTK